MKIEEPKRKGMRVKELFFYSTGYYFKCEYCLDVLQYLLQYSSCKESYCSKSKKNLEMGRLLEGFFCVNNGFSLQNLEIASLLVMLLDYHQQMLYLLILEKKVTIHTKKTLQHAYDSYLLW